MIADQQVRVEKRSIKTPLEFVDISQIMQTIIIIQIICAKSQKQTKKLYKTS